MNDLLAFQAQEKGIECVCLVDPEVPSLLRGDPGRIRQVLTNFVSNAVKFTSEGEVRVCVTLDEESGNEATIRFEVSDTGIGIPNDRLDYIFEAFAQADASTTRRHGGTGLGLAISKQLAEMMGGQIGVEGEEGAGSTFWFTAVLEKQPEDAQVLVPSPADLHSTRVLVVDTRETNRLVLKQQLLSLGCLHDEASDGNTAIEKLQAAVAEGDPFDIAVLNMRMREMDGETLGRRIKAEPVLRGVALLMMTSVGRRGDVARLQQAGFSAYLSKPVTRSQLHDCLVSVLGLTTAQEVSHPESLVTTHSIAENKKRKIRILVAEDNIVNQEVALLILKKLGYRANAVANGEEAVKALESIPYDLVLMDCQMPEMDGYEATANIRGRQSTVPNPSIPIIAMTASTMEGDREKCLAAGMNDYVSKPVKPKDLADALERQLQGKPSVSMRVDAAAPPRDTTG